MREILFRGKKIDNGAKQGQFVYGGYAEWGEKQSVIIEKGQWGKNNSHKVDPATVGQYTGLTDKNGKKIFEGDIVDFFGMRGKIVNEYGAFGIAVRDHIDYDLLDNNMPFGNKPNFVRNDNFVSLWEMWWNYGQDDNPIFEVEVIGNIHDNPELIGEEALEYDKR